MIFDSEMTFERFMELALHDPDHGYYGRRISQVGLRGDFTTAPMLSQAPAKAIAAWAAAALKDCDCRDLIEIGPGEGRLAGSVMAHLPFLQRRRTRLHLVETSEPLAARQKKLLGDRAIWHRDLREALAMCDGHAVIYSNELVDAFPVRRFKLTEDGWREMGVRFERGVFTGETLLPEAPLPDSTSFTIPHRIGQCIEVQDSYHHWLASWMPDWQAGRMLTIDYGAAAEPLYHRQPRGTLRAYLLQQRIEGPGIYENPGRQDLTADVNFTDLIQWSSPWISQHRHLSFGEFLTPFVNRENPADDAMLDEPGPGDAFRVLDQKRSFA